MMIISMNTKDETLDHTNSYHNQSQMTYKIDGHEMMKSHKITKTRLDSNTFSNKTRNNDTHGITQKSLNDEANHGKLQMMNATQQIKS